MNVSLSAMHVTAMRSPAATQKATTPAQQPAATQKATTPAQQLAASGGNFNKGPSTDQLSLSPLSSDPFGSSNPFASADPTFSGGFGGFGQGGDIINILLASLGFFSDPATNAGGSTTGSSTGAGAGSNPFLLPPQFAGLGDSFAPNPSQQSFGPTDNSNPTSWIGSLTQGIMSQYFGGGTPSNSTASLAGVPFLKNLAVEKKGPK